MNNGGDVCGRPGLAGGRDMTSTSVVKGRSVSAAPDSRVEEERAVLPVEDRVEERVVDRVAEEESSLGASSCQSLQREVAKVLLLVAPSG